MIYFKHSELTNDYHVSLKTVHNWIDAAKQGKLDLQLHEVNGRTYIANTPTNILLLEGLANKGKKYRNTLHHKVVTPKLEFYENYNRRQVLDIISSLEIHREIPRKYNYLDGGANNWDSWVKRLQVEQNSNILKGTIELLDSNMDSLLRLIEGYKYVNVIDVGVGNAMPIKELLGRLLGAKLLHRYVALDISDTMLRIAQQNIKEWFKGQVRFEGYARDVSYERFDDLLVDDMLSSDSASTINLVLYLGGTPTNFRSPADTLKVVCGSMGDKDLLIYTDKPDTEASRRYFDFNPQKGATTLSPNHSFILGLLNVDGGLYDTEMGYNENLQMRYIRIRLKTALTIKFRFEGGERDVVLEKGETILLLRIWHKGVLGLISEFEEVGFSLLQSSLTQDRQFLLTISSVNKSRRSEF